MKFFFFSACHVRYLVQKRMLRRNSVLPLVHVMKINLLIISCGRYPFHNGKVGVMYKVIFVISNLSQA